MKVGETWEEYAKRLKKDNEALAELEAAVEKIYSAHLFRNVGEGKCQGDICVPYDLHFNLMDAYSRLTALREGSKKGECDKDCNNCEDAEFEGGKCYSCSAPQVKNPTPNQNGGDDGRNE